LGGFKGFMGRVFEGPYFKELNKTVQVRIIIKLEVVSIERGG
jgi:hypothetical protein